MSYYIRIKGKPFGPFDEKQLSEMMTKGRIGRTTEISTNRQEWAAAETLAFLFPPATPAASSAPAVSPTAAPPMNFSASAASSEPADWFYSTDGTAGFGPVAQSTVMQMLQGGTLQGESLVWKQGQNAQKIRTVQEFAGYFAPSLDAAGGKSLFQRRFLFPLLYAAGLLLCGVVGWGGYQFVFQDKPNKGKNVANASSMSVDEIVKNARRAVVRINVIDSSGKSGSGTGFVVARDDNFVLMLTNRHVIIDALKDDTLGGRCDVVSEEYGSFSGNVVAMPRDKDTDLALVVARDPDEKLKPTLKIGNFNSLKIGADVLACGNPLGLNFSFAKGIVSATRWNREIQTDAAINSGNSGGPLIAKDTGLIVGVNTSSMGKALGNVEGVNFAIRADYVLESRNWLYDDDYEKDTKALINTINK